MFIFKLYLLMHILIVAERAKLPANGYGGLHRMVWGLAKALSDLGHKVSLLCARGSSCPFANVIWRDPSVPIAAQVPTGVDVVHFNAAPPDGFELPYVETIHGNFNKSFSHNAIFVSANHAARHGSSHYVYNGIDWDDPEYANPDLSPRAFRRYHFLGKADWKVKNLAGAIAVAKCLPSGSTLDVIGGRRFSFHMGLRFTLSQRIKFHGMVAGERKSALLRQSSGLIFPVVWHEPFGLAVVESLYMGAPVFATPYGALPEIVTPEVGRLSDSRSQMVYDITHADFSPRVCHEYARDVFNARRMAMGYVAKYEKVINGEVLNPVLPAIKTSACESLVWKNE